MRADEVQDDLDLEDLLVGSDEVDVDDGEDPNSGHPRKRTRSLHFFAQLCVPVFSFNRPSAFISIDFDLLGMFDGSPGTQGSPSAAVLGQPVLGAAGGASAPAHPTLSMLGSHMPCTMPSLQQQYTHAVLQQQQMWAQLQTNSGLTGGISRRGKTAAEVAEQQERIKRRRRESAQRSRQRKSAYMKTLECENHALKAENDALRRELSRLSGRPLPPPLPSCLTTSSSSAGLIKADDPLALYDQSSGRVGTFKAEGGICHFDASGLGAPAADQLLGMVL
jgi:hypothetical protein